MTQMDEQEQKRLIALVNDVAATVDIADVKFTSFSAKYDLAAKPESMAVHFKHKASASAQGPNEPKIIVLADFIMEARQEAANETGVPCCEIQAQIALTYESPKAMEFSPEHLAAFAHVNGIYNAWPYWRELVQSSTARMGLPPLIVPSLKPGGVSHERKKNDDQPGKVDGTANTGK